LKETTVRIFTIGFSEKPASRFFGLLHEHRVELLVDTRLRPDGQLAGFAKRRDLPFFLAKLAGCDYSYNGMLSPSDEILDAYRADKDWPAYVERFERLMDERDVPNVLDRSAFEAKRCCLLCSEASPVKCHRRLLAERMVRTWGDIEIVHLT
jgi:uncharacterized protein (DUF488 family)